MAMSFVWWVFREAVGLCKAASCTAFVNRYKAFAPGPATRTRLKTKTRTALRPWAKFFLDFWKCAPYNDTVNVSLSLLWARFFPAACGSRF